MTDEGTLTKFVDLACGEPDEWLNRRHCLIFWGHGTELLLDKELEGTSRYLTLRNCVGINEHEINQL